MAELPFEVSVHEVKRRQNAGEAFALIDVREPVEQQTAGIAGAELIPMNLVPAQLQRIEAIADEKPVVVFCHHGVRSLNVVSWLRRQGVENCQSMAGGIEAWSLEVDPGVPRY